MSTLPGGGKSNNGNATNGTSNQAPAQAPAANSGDGTGGFTGFEPFGGNRSLMIRIKGANK